MIDNILNRINGKLIRLDVNFCIQEQYFFLIYFRNIDNLIGRAAHISFINNAEMLRTFCIAEESSVFWLIFAWILANLSGIVFLYIFLYFFFISNIFQTKTTPLRQNRNNTTFWIMSSLLWSIKENYEIVVDSSHWILPAEQFPSCPESLLTHKSLQHGSQSISSNVWIGHCEILIQTVVLVAVNWHSQDTCGQSVIFGNLY